MWLNFQAFDLISCYKQKACSHCCPHLWESSGSGLSDSLVSWCNVPSAREPTQQKELISLLLGCWAELVPLWPGRWCQQGKRRCRRPGAGTVLPSCGYSDKSNPFPTFSFPNLSLKMCWKQQPYKCSQVTKRKLLSKVASGAQEGALQT